MLCAFCGSVVTTRLDRLATDTGSLREALAAALEPSAMALRERALHQALAGATAAGDRVTHEAAARELAALQPALHPEYVPAYAHASNQGFAAWAQTFVSTQKIVAFDPTVASLASSLDPMALVRERDAFAAAVTLLGRCRAYTRALLDHPDYRPSGPPVDADTLASDTLRTLLLNVAAWLPVGVPERIAVDVLGDASTDGRCAGCGAPLESTIDGCAFCGASREMAEGDLWLAAMLRQWELGGVTRPGARPLSEAAAMLSGAVHLGGRPPAPEDALRFLRAIYPRLTVTDLRSATESFPHMGHGLGEYRQRLLNGLADAPADPRFS